ncbi:MAG: hypothetical protein V1815_02360 [Candidatus Woesearchaeota archaeon]
MDKLYLLKGKLYAERIVPLEERISAPNNKKALDIAKGKAQQYYLLERYSVLLYVLNKKGEQIGKVSAPSKDQIITCEDCIKEKLNVSARYREVYNDGGGSDVCKKHILSNEKRKEWHKKGLLERVFDYKLKKEVNPINLR